MPQKVPIKYPKSLKNPKNQNPAKKHQGKLAECVQELNKYLSIYQCDGESWWELAEIYLNENEYEKAAFCFEEIIIIQPTNPLIYQVQHYSVILDSAGFTKSRVSPKETNFYGEFIYKLNFP